MKSNKNLLPKILIGGVILLSVSIYSILKFTSNNINLQYHYGASQILLLVLTIVNGSVFGYGLSLARRFRHVGWSVLYTLITALIIIGCVYLFLLMALASGYHNIHFDF